MAHCHTSKKHKVFRGLQEALQDPMVRWTLAAVLGALLMLGLFASANWSTINGMANQPPATHSSPIITATPVAPKK